MSEFSPAQADPPPPASSEPAPPASETEPPSSPPVPAAPAGRGLPSWLPYFLLAVVPALITGLVVYAAGGGGGGGSDAAAIVDGLFRSGGSDDDIQSFRGQLPPGFPADLPRYPGAKVLVSFLVRSSEGANYFVIYESGAGVDEILSFYQEKLDKEPWQVEGAISSEQIRAVAFSRPDDADVEGNVTVASSELGDKAAIYVSFQDVTPTGLRPIEPKPFVLRPTLALPPGFPSDVPIYSGKEKSTVTSTRFQRGGGTTSYQIAFVTKNSDVDVINFYRSEFQKRGWIVTDGQPLSTRDFSISIDFRDGPRQLLQGNIRADAHPDDGAYTLVVLSVDVSASRGRGN